MATVTAIPTAIDGELVQVMDAMPYGVYIVGSSDAAGELNGMMADWVMQVSFRPRLLAISFEQDAHTLANIREHGWFVVNFLPANDDGRKLAARFAQPYDGGKVLGRTEGQKAVIHHKIEGIPHSATAHGSPVLDGAMAWVECRSKQFVPAGDHVLVVAEVTGGELRSDQEALSSAYTGWTYSG
jgi:flavin reductase (DIM6/NTAB) family NADH-FMN oxidoreductase RutF